jgi:hypothetical protein
MGGVMRSRTGLSHTICMWLPMALLYTYWAVEFVAIVAMVLGFTRLVPEDVLWWAILIFFVAKLLLPLSAITFFFQPSHPTDTADDCSPRLVAL